MKLEKLQTFAAGVQAFRIVTDEGSNGSGSKPTANEPVQRSEAAKRLGRELRRQVTEVHSQE